MNFLITFHRESVPVIILVGSEFRNLLFLKFGDASNLSLFINFCFAPNAGLSHINKLIARIMEAIADKIINKVIFFIYK